MCPTASLRLQMFAKSHDEFAVVLCGTEGEITTRGVWQLSGGAGDIHSPLPSPPLPSPPSPPLHSPPPSSPLPSPPLHYLYLETSNDLSESEGGYENITVAMEMAVPTLDLLHFIETRISPSTASADCIPPHPLGEGHTKFIGGGATTPTGGGATTPTGGGAT